MLKEILFVDYRRLDDFASQLNPSGCIIEKGKEFNAGLSLTGPNVMTKQTERVRPLTVHEKMKLIQEHLEEVSSLLQRRPRSYNDGPPFVLEKCVATKYVIPYKDEDGVTPRTFVYWLSQNPRKGMQLCLLEDFEGNGAPPTYVRQLSPYTILSHLLENDPRFLLERSGGYVSKSRKIETLYLVRDYGREVIEGPRNIAVFGYPIWIAVDHSWPARLFPESSQRE